MVYILLPAFNEEHDIGVLLQRICDAMCMLPYSYKVLMKVFRSPLFCNDRS